MSRLADTAIAGALADGAGPHGARDGESPDLRGRRKALSSGGMLRYDPGQTQTGDCTLPA
jgi:hypothetical protein